MSSDAYPLDPKTSKDTNDVNLESDEELHFDKEALATHSNRESANYILRQNKLSKDGPNPGDTIFELLEDENEMEILDFLRTHFVDLTKLKDARGYTVLHIVAYKGLESMWKMLLTIAKDKSLAGLEDKEKTKRVKQWVNVKTNEDEFTALHMASFSGKYGIVSMLIENKANIYAKNKDGLNMLHTAAQGDQAFMLYYFKELGLDVNSKDNRGSTPLHWAWFSKSEIAISYLLAWDTKIDEADQRGLTPLHLAVKAVNDLNTTRPVRALLIWGASRNKEDLIKRKPIDLISEVEDPKLRKELKEILKKPSSFSCLMLKTPLRKVRKSPITMLFYLFLLLILIVLLFLFIFPTTIDYDPEQYLIFGLSGLGVLTLLLLLIGSWKNPGYLEKPKIQFLTLLDKLDPTMLCPEWEVIRTPRSRHCSICNKWVERFDHHCPWINNCVGVKNHVIFMFFLFFTEVSLICTIVLIAMKFNVYNLNMQEMYDKDNLWLYYIPRLIPEYFYWKEVIMGIKIGIVAWCGIFVLPLLLLILVQLKNSK
jgi:palmitoyltransferase ZDHHC13/17